MYLSSFNKVSIFFHWTKEPSQDLDLFWTLLTLLQLLDRKAVLLAKLHLVGVDLYLVSDRRRRICSRMLHAGFSIYRWTVSVLAVMTTDFSCKIGIRIHSQTFNMRKSSQNAVPSSPISLVRWCFSFLGHSCKQAGASIGHLKRRRPLR